MRLARGVLRAAETTHLGVGVHHQVPLGPWRLAMKPFPWMLQVRAREVWESNRPTAIALILLFLGLVFRNSHYLISREELLLHRRILDWQGYGLSYGVIFLALSKIFLFDK
jgi:hypothetical protein